MDFVKAKSDLDQSGLISLWVQLSAAASDRFKLRQNAGRRSVRSGGCFIYRGAPARASGRSITHFAAPPGALEVTAEAAPLYKWWGQTAFYGLAGGDLVAHNSTGQLLEERPPSSSRERERRASSLAAANPICNGPKVSSGRARGRKALDEQPRARVCGKSDRLLWNCSARVRYH